MLGHATYHILLLSHLNIKPLLLHPHRLILKDLLVGVKSRFQDFGLDAGEAIAGGVRTIPLLLHLCLMKLGIHVLLYMSSILLKLFDLLFDVVNFLKENGLID